MDAKELLTVEEDCIALLQEMIRIPSVNYGEGKGNEAAMATFVAEKLSEVGITSTFYESAENRVNVVAKIPGVDQKRVPEELSRPAT